MAMEALGRTFNAAQSVTTANLRFNLRNASGITFLLANAITGATNATLQEHSAAAAGTSQNLVRIRRVWTQSAAGVWTLVSQAAAATFNVPITAGLTAVYVDGDWLSPGFPYVSVSHATAVVIGIPHDLTVQRKLNNLPGTFA